MTKVAYRQLGTRALRWIKANLGYFSVSAPDNDLTLVREIKPIAELGLACDLLLKTGAASSLAIHRTVPVELIAHCWRQLSEGEHLRHLLLTYPDLFSLVTVYPPFVRAGFRNPGLDSVIRSLSMDSGIRALEFPAWRLLDFAAALRALCVPSPWKLRHEFDHTWLGKTPAPWMLSDSAAYSFTHTVFCMTDFGCRPRDLPVRARKYASQWVPVWSAYYARVWNLDLCGEMLMAAHCLGVQVPSDPLMALVGGQRRDGSVPGPHGIAASMEMRSGKKSARQQFLLDYHTTVVGLMTSVLGLRNMSGRSGQPPRRQRGMAAAQQQHAAHGAARRR
jgi:hypothetical protein